MDIAPEYVIGAFSLLSAAAGGGAAWGGAKAALNGTKDRVKNLDKGFAEHKEQDNQHQLEVVQRLASLEAHAQRLKPIEEKLDRVLRRSSSDQKTAD